METIVGIASVPSRKVSLEKVLDSLTEQVDEIYLVLNYGEENPPEYLKKYSNVLWTTCGDTLGDAMKFSMVNYVKGIYLGCDDDLIYPKGYVQYMAEGVKKYNGLVSLHGRRYALPITSFRRWTANYRCLGDVKEDVNVNFIGSGCCAFHTNRLKVSLEDFKLPNMADCFLSRQASLQGVLMVILKHSRDYLQYTNPETTIWRSAKNFDEQTKILQSYIK
jgi:hypothetical protein